MLLTLLCHHAELTDSEVNKKSLVDALRETIAHFILRRTIFPVSLVLRSGDQQFECVLTGAVVVSFDVVQVVDGSILSLHKHARTKVAIMISTSIKIWTIRHFSSKPDARGE